LKKAILSSILLLSSTSIFADTTMCFKENHSSMSTIENIPFEGGLCAGKNSINDMKAKGWNVDDIKISQTPNGMNFIYILKDGKTIQPISSSNFPANSANMEANIIAKLEKKKEDEKKAKDEKELKEAVTNAETLYVNKCQNCHGTNGEKNAYNSSRPLKDLTLDDMKESIKDFKNGKNNSINASIMAPYANFLDNKDIENVYAYLKKINKK